jgi:Abnormal spindle-like microcephaly-assoc'd, ASPM-SPD-2-Hydin
LVKDIFQEILSHFASLRLGHSRSKKNEHPIRTWITRLLLLSILIAGYGVGSAQVAIQTNVSTTQNSASSKITSQAFSTSAPNQLLLALVAADSSGSPNATVQSVSGAGLTWVLVKRTNTQAGTAEIWRAFAPAALSSVKVTAALSQSVVSSMTILSFTGVATTGSNGSGAIGAVASGSASKGAPTASLVSTQSGSLVVGVGNDFDNAIARSPLAGQTLVNQVFSSTGDTYWVQYVNAPISAKGTTVTLGDSAPSTDRYNLSLCEVVPNGSSGVGTSQLALSAGTLAFGNVNVKTTSTQTLTLTSSGTAAVTVNAATLTGAGFTMSGATFPLTLNPGQAATLQVSYSPTADGSATGSITLSSNSSSGGTSTVSLSGTGISPQLTLSSGALAFGNVAVNSTGAQTLTVTSSGTAALTINSATLSGTGFKMSGATFPVTLNPGQTVSFQVSFAPTTAGSATGTITLSSNSASGTTSTVSLTGTGVSSQLTVSASSLAFGNVVLNSTLSKTLTLTSSGTAAVTVNSATVSGAGFTISGATFPATLNPGASISLQVNFNPTVAGSASGSITISSTSGTAATTTVSLSGVGTVPQLGVSSTSLAFGSVTLNTTSTQTLTLTSSGTAAVTVNSATLSGTGFTMSGAAFPATLNPGASISLQVNFSPTVAGSASGSITISSNSNTGGTATVSLSGSGTSTNSVLSLSANSLSFGNDSVGTAITQSVTLTSTGTSAVTVSAATITGAGFSFSGATFPVTLNPNVAIQVVVQFNPTAVGAASGTLSFSSNSTNGGTSVVSLSGNGTAAQHNVSLSWSAPVNSPVQVADYNIYRAVGGSTSYQLLNSSSSTSFVDATVNANTTYAYYVTSVGTTGTESSPSSSVTASVPK